MYIYLPYCIHILFVCCKCDLYGVCYYRTAAQQGYVVTISGRRRYIDHIKSADERQRATAERQAVNSVIQGSASDVIKLAMLLIHQSLPHFQLPSSSSSSTTTSTTSTAAAPMQETKDPGSTSASDTGVGKTDNKAESQQTRIPRLLMQIHDELIYEIPIPFPSASLLEYPENKQYITSFVTNLSQCMEQQVIDTLSLSVPLTSNVKIGYSWGAMSAL